MILMMTKMLNFVKSGIASRAKHFFSEYIKTSSNANKKPAQLVLGDAFLNLQTSKDNVCSEYPLPYRGLLTRENPHGYKVLKQNMRHNRL